MTRILLRKVRGAKVSGLIPIDDISEQALGKIPDGEVMTVTLRKARNPKLQGLYWSALHKVFDNQERYATVHDLHDAIKVQAGVCKTLFLPGGVEVMVPDSTSFDDMDDFTFREYVDRAFDIIAKKYLIDVRDAAALRELTTMIGGMAA